MRKIIILTLGLLMFMSACSGKKNKNSTKLVFMVTKQQDDSAAQLSSYLDLETVFKHIGIVDAKQLRIIDLNNDKPVKHELVDVDVN